MRQGHIVWTSTTARRGATSTTTVRYVVNMISDDHFRVGLYVILQRTPARARNSDDAEELESLSSCPSSTQPASETQERGRGKAKRPHKSVESSSSPSLRRPQFGSDWDLARLRPRKQAEPGPLPLQLDSRGKPKGLLQCGPRVRIKTK